MGLMDHIRLYRQLKGGKEEFLDSLEEKIIELNESKPSYYKIGEEIVDRLESKIDFKDDGIFRIDDWVIMNKEASWGYLWTQEGDEGVITNEYDDGEYEIKFTKLIGETLNSSKIHIINKRFMDKIESIPFMLILDTLKENGEFNVGDKVVLGEINEENRWHPDYQKERNENYPEGTKGIVYDYEYDPYNINVRFSKKGNWSRKWDDSIIKDESHIASYKANELILPQNQEKNYSKFIDKLSKYSDKSLIDKIRTEVESKYDFEKYEKQKEELIKKNTQLMKIHEMSESKIKEYFIDRGLM